MSATKLTLAEMYLILKKWADAGISLADIDLVVDQIEWKEVAE